MTFEDALRIVGLEEDFEPANLEREFSKRVAELERRIATAPSDALKTKYVRQLAELQAARAMLLGGAQVSGFDAADLPISEPDAEASLVPPPPGASLLFGPRIGQTFAGKYVLASLEYQGKLSMVFLADDPSRGGAKVRLRILGSQLGATAAARDAFVRAASALKLDQRRGLPRVTDAGFEGAYAFVVTEAPDGSLWQQRMTEIGERRRRLTLSEGMRLIGDLTDAADAISNTSGPIGWLTPDGIMRGASGATSIDDAFTPKAATGGQQVESASIAPEVRSGGQAIQASVQFSIGALVYQALSGIAPSSIPRQLASLRPDLPPAFCSAIDRSLSADPFARHTDLASFRAAAEAGTAIPIYKQLPVIAGAGALALILVALLGWQAVGSILKSQQQLLNDQDAVLRLQSQADSEADAIEDLRRSTKEIARDAANEAKEIESQERYSPSGDGKERLREARTRAGRLKEIVDAFEQQYTDPKQGMSRAKSDIELAARYTEGGKVSEARALYEEAAKNMQVLRTLPERMQADFSAGDAFKPINGRWSLEGDVCGTDSEFVLTVKGYDLLIERPANDYRMNVELAHESSRIRGKFNEAGMPSSSEYQVDQTTLVIANVGGKTLRLTRCQ